MKSKLELISTLVMTNGFPLMRKASKEMGVSPGVWFLDKESSLVTAGVYQALTGVVDNQVIWQDLYVVEPSPANIFLWAFWQSFN